ncbi:MAG: histone deacetylase family protein [Promethearchaeota archaeon]
MVTGIIYDDRYLEHKTGMHVESPERLIAITNFIKELNMLDDENFTLVKPKLADMEDIKLVHDIEMIKKAEIYSKKAINGNLQVLDFGDTVVSERSYEVALLAAGGVIIAADAVIDGELQNAFALVRPPGHHANRFRSSGFCIFNNMAIMAEHLIKNRGLKKVAIFDIDLHHGNGTSEIFYERNDVLFYSSHQDGRTQYPGTGFVSEIGENEGEGYNINLPLTPGASDDVVIKTVEKIIKPIFLQFKPEILLGSIGLDAHHSDPLSGLEFTTQGYGNYVKMFKDIADESCEGKMVLTLEGGYKVKILAKSVVNILKVLADEEPPFIEPDRISKPNVLQYHDALIEKMRNTLSKYWKL